MVFKITLLLSILVALIKGEVQLSAESVVPKVAEDTKARVPPMGTELQIESSPTYMATPESFNNIMRNGCGSNKKSNLPAETHLAWLEYLANAYIQCDDFQHAREVVTEMYNWLVEPQRLRGEVSSAIQILQRRIDERHECLMTQYGPGKACARPESIIKDNKDDAMAKVMARVKDVESQELNAVEKEQLSQVHGLLRSGHVNSAMQMFHQIAQASRTTVLKEKFGRIEFVLKLVRFDLENPNNCMPLWRTTCCLDWKMKHHILDAYDILSGRAFHNHRNVVQPTLRQILSRLDGMPLASELKTRLLIADGRVQAWNHLSHLTEPDRYLAEACLILKGVPKPKDLPANARMRASNNIAAEQLNSRALASGVLRHCMKIGNGAPSRCQEALSELESLQKACPYGGFVRVGVFSQVFGDYLFIKCLSLPYTLPASLPNLPSLEDVSLEAKAEIASSLNIKPQSTIFSSATTSITNPSSTTDSSTPNPSMMSSITSASSTLTPILSLRHVYSPEISAHSLSVPTNSELLAEKLLHAIETMKKTNNGHDLLSAAKCPTSSPENDTQVASFVDKIVNYVEKMGNTAPSH